MYTVPPPAREQTHKTETTELDATPTQGTELFPGEPHVENRAHQAGHVAGGAVEGGHELLPAAGHHLLNQVLHFADSAVHRSGNG